MTLLDKTKQTISTTGKNITSKAKEMLEITNLTGQINTQLDMIDKEYTEIGKAYYELHKENPEEECAVACATIADAYQVIDELRAQIQKLRGVRVCSQCGAEIIAGAHYCMNCGAKVDTEEEIEEVDEATCHIIDLTQEQQQSQPNSTEETKGEVDNKTEDIQQADHEPLN